MNLNLHDKVFIVSGGARGIGQAICNLIFSEGGIPVIVDPNVVSKDTSGSKAAGNAARSLSIPVILDTPQSCQNVVNQVFETFGRVDGVVNNAGRNDGAGLSKGTPERFAQSVSDNLFHCFNLVHFALPHLIEAGGTIVNIASKTAITGQGNTSGYAAAKGALLALTREWAVELSQHQIRVNAVIPAEVMTPMYENWLATMEQPETALGEIQKRIPLGQRMTQPEEIASMVCFLLSDAAGHITGQHIHVDGGYVHLDRAIGTFEPQK